jgi:ATP-dependent protease ClpP protease subunit
MKYNFRSLLMTNQQHEVAPVNLVRNGDEASLYVYDVIDEYYGVSAASVIDAIAQAEGSPVLNIYINSPGGSVFEARAIMAAIGRFKGKTVAHIDALCASAATSIALSCSEVVMKEGALFMIHCASGMAYGDKDDMLEMAALLEKIELSIIRDYTEKTGKSDEEILAMMEAETWMTASEALEAGFIDRIDSVKSVKNVWNLSAFKNAPALEPDPLIESTPEPINEPSSEGFFMSEANANRLRILQIA